MGRKNGNRKDIEKSLRLEWSKNLEAEVFLDHVHAYACICTAEIISIKIYGNIKGQKQSHNFPEVIKFDQRSFWCHGLLCRYDRQKCEKNSTIGKKSIITRYDVWLDNNKRIEKFV